MKLDSTQKKYVKKWIKKKSVTDIAADLNLAETDILAYLKQKWGEAKFTRLDKQYGLSERLVRQTLPDSPQSVVADKAHSFFNWLSARWMHVVFLFVLVAIVYFNTLDNAFVSDDIAGIATNANIGNLHYVFRNFLSAIGDLEFFIIYKIFGLSPTFFRLNNIIFHFFNCVAVYYLVETLTNKRVGLLSAILFAVHPIQIEAVTWISGGLVSHSATFVLIAMALFVKSLDKSMLDKRYLLAVFMYFIGVYFSEKNMGFPMILIMLLFALKKLKQAWYKTIPFFLLSGIWVATYISMIPARVGALNVEYSTATVTSNPLIQIPIAISSYLQLIVFPQALTFYHTQIVLSSTELAVRILVTVLVIGLALFSLKKNRQILFWISFLFLALSPTLTPFGVSSMVAERYVYLGALGVYVVFALLVDRFFVKPKTQNIVAGILAIIIILLMGRSYLRNQDWQNQDTLWLATDKYSPYSPQNHNNLGDYYGRQGDMENAIKQFQRAIALNPNYAHAHHNLANIYAQIGQLDLALANYQMAAKLNPNQWQSFQQAALIYYLKKDQTNALLYINHALSLNPTDQRLQQQKQIIETGVAPEQ